MKKRFLKIFFILTLVLNYSSLVLAQNQYNFSSPNTDLSDIINQNKGMLKEKFRLNLDPTSSPSNTQESNSLKPATDETTPSQNLDPKSNDTAQFGYDKNAIRFTPPSAEPDIKSSPDSTKNTNNQFGFFSIDDIPTQKHHSQDGEY